MYSAFPNPSQQPQQIPVGGFSHIPHQGMAPHQQPPTSGQMGQQSPFSVGTSQPGMGPQPPTSATMQPVSGIPSLDQVRHVFRWTHCRLIELGHSSTVYHWQYPQKYLPFQLNPAISAALMAGAGGGVTGLPQKEQEKLDLIMQVLSLSEESIALLPEDEQRSIRILKEQVRKRGVF